MKNFSLTAQQRKIIYTIALAITALLGARGILDRDIVETINLVIAAIFGVAINNASDKNEEQ